MSDKIDREDTNTPEQKPTEVIGVQFPTLDSKDLPKQENENQYEDIPMVDDVPMLEEIPELEEDAPTSQNWLHSKVAKMDDVEFRRVQTILGIVLGLVAVVCLCMPFRNADGTSSMWGMVIAMVLVLLLPRFIEKKIKQPLMHMQKILIVVMIIGLVIYGGYAFTAGGMSGTDIPTASASPSPEIQPSPTSTILS